MENAGALGCAVFDSGMLSLFLSTQRPNKKSISGYFECLLPVNVSAFETTFKTIFKHAILVISNTSTNNKKNLSLQFAD